MEPKTRLVKLTGERFERFEVYESYLSMDIPRELPRDVTIWIWGAYVDVDLGEGETHCYVRGYAPVVFREVTGLAIRVGLRGLETIPSSSVLDRQLPPELRGKKK